EDYKPLLRVAFPRTRIRRRRWKTRSTTRTMLHRSSTICRTRPARRRRMAPTSLPARSNHATLLIGRRSRRGTRACCSATRYDRRMDATRTDIPADWLADFEAASRRPLALRMRYAFIHTDKPGL